MARGSIRSATALQALRASDAAAMRCDGTRTPGGWRIRLGHRALRAACSPQGAVAGVLARLLLLRRGAAPGCDASLPAAARLLQLAAEPQPKAHCAACGYADVEPRQRHLSREESASLPLDSTAFAHLSRRFLAPRAAAYYWNFLIFWHIGLLKRYGTARSRRSFVPPYPANKNRG